MKKVLAVLRENLKDDEFRVDHPRMSLEEFFLDVVNKARVEHVETFGARSSGHIAEYLSAGSEEKNADGALLDRLAGRVPEPTAPEPEKVDAAKEKEKAEEKKILQSLSKDREAEESARKAQEELQAARAKLSDANDKLKDLLGSRGKKDGE